MQPPPRAHEETRIQFLDQVQTLSLEDETQIERPMSEGSDEAEEEGAQLMVLDPDHVRKRPGVLLSPHARGKRCGLFLPLTNLPMLAASWLSSATPPALFPKLPSFIFCPSDKAP